MFIIIILHCSGRILVFYGVCTHLLCLFSPGSGQMMDAMDIVLGPVVPKRKEAKNKKIVNLELTNKSRRKPTAIRDYCKFNDQLYGRTFLVVVLSTCHWAWLSCILSSSCLASVIHFLINVPLAAVSSIYLDTRLRVL